MSVEVGAETAGRVSLGSELLDGPEPGVTHHVDHVGSGNGSDWLGADDRMAESVYIENSDLLACVLNAECIGVCVCERDGLALESRVKATYTD